MLSSFRADGQTRRVIAEKLKESGHSQTWLSRKLKRGRTYINQYLDGSPRDLDYNDKLAISKFLGVPVSELGVAPIEPVGNKAQGNLSEDAEAYEPGLGHYLARSEFVGYFRMKSLALDEHPERILPGNLLAFNLNIVRPEAIETGRIVVAQLYDKRELAKGYGTIIRQFISPNKLITNSSAMNVIISLDDPSLPYEAVIKGALVSVVREFN